MFNFGNLSTYCEGPVETWAATAPVPCTDEDKSTLPRRADNECKKIRKGLK